MTATELLVFARCAGFYTRAPGFSHPSVPRTVRAGLALLTAMCVAPGVRAAHVVGVGLVLALIVETLIGAAVGMAASLLYDGAYAAGRILDDYVGVKAIAPSVAIVAPSGFGRLWSLAFTGGYFLFGAYGVAIAAFADGFRRFVPGTLPAGDALFAFATSVAQTIVSVALGVAAPAIAMAFVVQVALAALSRAVPRFSSFTLSFPLVFGAVLVSCAIALPIVVARSAQPIVFFPWTKP